MEKYRVGVVGGSNRAVGWVREEFGVDVSRFGNLTPGEVHALGVKAAELKKQAEYAKYALKHLAEIAKYKALIEQFRVEAIQKGLAAKEEIDGYVYQSIMSAAKHDAHLRRILQKTQGDLKVVAAQNRSDLELEQNSFQNRLRVIWANHQQKMGTQAVSYRQQIGEIRNREFEARRAAEEREYLDGKQGRTAAGFLGGFASWFR